MGRNKQKLGKNNKQTKNQKRRRKEKIKKKQEKKNNAEQNKQKCTRPLDATQHYKLILIDIYNPFIIYSSRKYYNKNNTKIFMMKDLLVKLLAKQVSIRILQQNYFIVRKMCAMFPKMCGMVPKMCCMRPKMCGMVPKM